MNFQYTKVNQIAKVFCVTRGVVISWIHNGTLPAVTTPGGQYRILISDVEKLQEKIKFNPNA